MSRTNEEWQRLSDLFDELVEQPAAAQKEHLATLAAQDAALAHQLQAMLLADAQASGVLDHGIEALAPTVVDGLARRSDESTPEPAPGSIGRFRLIRLLGRGGMGEVYLAESTQGDFVQQVALKLLKRGMDSDDILRRFAQERRILAQLNHPNIARLVDGGISEQGRPYYAMEYVDGLSLTDYAREQGLDVRDRVRLMIGICAAVAHAQTRLVVHRDLKPSNILVDGSGQPRVLDFGIAKILGDTGDDSLTRTGVRALSPAYAAPEQVTGEPISTATDVYALGVILYELLSGQLPHPRSNATQLTDETLERPSQSLRGLRNADTTGAYASRSNERERHARSIAGDLDTIVLTALKREPERRYANAAALANDLGRWLDGRTVNARADSAAYRAVKFIRRNRVAVAAGVLVVLSLIGGLGVALWQTKVARAAGFAAEEQAAIATAVSAFLTEDVIRVANPYRSKLDLRLSDALKQASGAVAQRFAAQPRTEGVVRRTLAESLRLAGEPASALEQAQAALNVLETHFGASDTDSLRARAVLGRLLIQAERTKEAREVFETGLRQAPASPLDPSRLRFEIGLACVDVEQRRENEGLARLTSIEANVRTAFGAWSDELIDVYNHRMRALAHTDRFEETLVVARELLAGAESRFGAGDPRTQEWRQRESVALRLLKRFDESLQSMEKALAIARARLGESHPATFDTRLQAGIVLFELKRFAEAGEHFDAVVDFRSRTMGRSNDNTLTARVWQARQRQRTGQVAQAKQMFESLYADARGDLGEDNPNTLPFAQTLGMFLMQTGEHAAAESLQRELIVHARKVLTPGHVNIAKYAYDLAENLAAQPQRAGDTAQLLQEWLPHWQTFFGEADSRVVDGKRWLGEAQARLAQGKQTP